MLYDCKNTIIIIINHASAILLNCFTQLRAPLVLHDRGNIIIIIIHDAFAGQLNCLTQPRALLVLHDHNAITRYYYQ
jgi:hypothetical protein